MVIYDADRQRVILENVISQVLDLVHKSSATAEVLVTKTTGIFISTRYGKLENMEFNKNTDLEVSVYYKNRKGTSSSNDISSKAISSVVNAALDIAYYTSFDICSRIADKELLAFSPIDLDLFHPIEFNVHDGISLASTSELIALKKDKRIMYSEGGYFNSYCSTKAFGNSHGMLQSYNISNHLLSCGIIAESDGEMVRHYEYTTSRVFDNLQSPEFIGENCAQRVLKHLNAKKLHTLECPVIFMSEVAISLFNYLAEAIHGINVYRQSTFLLNFLNKQIFPSWLSIEEKPHILRGFGSFPFDKEGVYTNDRNIVKNGILNTWLLNTYTACKLGLKNTGHASSFYNWYISYQNVTFLELVRKMWQGVVVTELIGQGVNILTGDYSRGAFGFWVDHGVIQYPINEITIAGNLKDMLRNIICISNDIEKRSNIFCGSILFSSMKIAGQ